MSALKAILYSIHDSAMVLAPRKWISLDIHLKENRLSHIESKGATGRQNSPKPQLNFNLKNEASLLSEAILALLAELRQNGKNISPEILRFERTERVLNIQFLMGGRVVWFSRLELTELSTLLITDELFDVLLGTEAAFHQLQGQLQTRLGAVTDFHFDPVPALLTVVTEGSAQIVKAQMLGHYLFDDFTWIWSWSEPSTLRNCVDKVEAVCAPHLMPDGLAAFWRPSFHCDEGFAWALAASISVSIGARGLFRGSVAGGAVFFAPLE